MADEHIERVVADPGDLWAEDGEAVQRELQRSLSTREVRKYTSL
jgi:hypothetical protein